jgi:hypothetical protein
VLAQRVQGTEKNKLARITARLVTGVQVSAYSVQRRLGRQGSGRKSALCYGQPGIFDQEVYVHQAEAALGSDGESLPQPGSGVFQPAGVKRQLGLRKVQAAQVLLRPGLEDPLTGLVQKPSAPAEVTLPPRDISQDEVSSCPFIVPWVASDAAGGGHGLMLAAD